MKSISLLSHRDVSAGFHRTVRNVNGNVHMQCGFTFTLVVERCVVVFFCVGATIEVALDGGRKYVHVKI